MEIRISCLNCTNYCKNKNLNKFKKHLEQLSKKGGYDKAVIKCGVLKSSLKENNIKTIEVVLED